ncbi:MAG: hypothetical protein ACI4RH_04900, partial [Huintestinicola sp.]
KVLWKRNSAALYILREYLDLIAIAVIETVQLHRKLPEAKESVITVTRMIRKNDLIVILHKKHPKNFLWYQGIRNLYFDTRFYGIFLMHKMVKWLYYEKSMV